MVGDIIGPNEYKRCVENLINRAPNEETKNKLTKILLEGGYDKFTVNSNITTPNNEMHETERRLIYASLLLTDPQTFEKIEKRNLTLFHGTNSNALKDILNNGMQSEYEIIKRGKEVLTGEFSRPKPRNFISFTDNLEIALAYASIKPSSKAKGNSSFGLLVAISTEDIINNNNILTTHVYSDMPEIGIINHLPQEYIKMIAVPQCKIKEVNKLVKKYKLDGIEVVPAEGIINAISLMYNARGYEVSEDSDCLLINEKKAESKVFTSEDIKQIAQGMRAGRIKAIYSKLKEKIKGNNEKSSNEISKEDER